MSPERHRFSTRQKGMLSSFWLITRSIKLRKFWVLIFLPPSKSEGLGITVYRYVIRKEGVPLSTIPCKTAIRADRLRGWDHIIQLVRFLWSSRLYWNHGCNQQHKATQSNTERCKWRQMAFSARRVKQMHRRSFCLLVEGSECNWHREMQI